MDPASIQPSQEIEPLTQKSKDGDPYRRDIKVEEQIRWALTLSHEALLDCLHNAKPEESNYLREETLVYLIRAYDKDHQREIIQELWRILYQRCVKMIRAKIPQVDGRSDQAYQEIQTQLYSHIVHPEGKQGDFLQVRFWVAFRALVISIARRLIKDLKNDKLLDPLTNLPGEELEQLEEEPGESIPGFAHLSGEGSDSIPTERMVIGAEGLSLLPKDLRKVFILYHGFGYPIESHDPDELTLCKLFGKSPRMIHYWLENAEKILNQWRGETHEKS